jgi:glycosyltransferase involved in cell wall biosynthesis
MNIASQKPLVSVVIPVFNAEETIVEALESVSCQTYSPIELVVVDDGSTDNTTEVINNYHQWHLKNCQEKTPIEFRYIHQENGGPSKARNTGIMASNGEYIAFLDADDLWTGDKLEKQLRIFSREPSVDIVFTDVKISRLRNNQIEEFTVFHKKKLSTDFFGHEFIVVDPFEKLMKLNFMPTPSVVARRACFDNGRLFNEKRRHVEDWELWLKMSLSLNFAYVKDVCVHVREMGDGLSSNEVEMMISIIDIFESFIEEHKNSGLPLNRTVLLNSLKTQYKWTGYILMKNRKNKLARVYFRKSLAEGIDLKTICYYLSTFFRAI